VLEDACELHDMHHLKMLAGRDTFVHGCPRCAAAEAEAAEDTIIGACPACGEGSGGELAIKQLRSGSRLVGCTRYPNCEYSLPLPRRGDVEVTSDRCVDHNLPELHLHDGDDDPWELGCPICNYREYQAEQAIDDLEDIDGIGRKTAEKLTDAGVNAPADLVDVDIQSVADRVQGVTPDKLRDWQEQVTG
jgi:DNA topoisomerase-1